MTSLNTILRANAGSCLGFGTLFLVAQVAVSECLGAFPAPMLTVIGAGLVVNGLHLVMASMRAAPLTSEIVWFSLGDLLWWTGSLALIASGFWITSPSGVISVLVLALAVAALGVAQLAILGVSRSGLSRTDHWRRIGRSWLCLPVWVKVWLFFLNGTFLAAPVLLPWNDARVVLLAYAASGPLLLGFALHEGGMTRHMGVGHLIPWIPLLGWLGYRLTAANEVNDAVLYMAFLAALTIVCLAFDIYDIARWLRGERSILIAPSLTK